MRNTGNNLAMATAIALSWTAPGSAASARKLVLVDRGVSLAPIVISKDAPPFTRRAADELAEYIEKISRAKPRVIEGEPEPRPEQAIWIGNQPLLKALFPKVDFDFRHPEEVLIAANASHLVIAGRDRWDPGHLVVKGKRNTVDGIQQEYGTANAVYTFLQNFLDVRWLWPGEMGEDIVEKETIAFDPFEYRHHPPLRARAGLFGFSVLLRHSGYGHSGDWVRFQRIQLDSLGVHPGHAFKTWWERFHEKTPGYFALQPDGTRGGGERPYPSAKTVKICESNPAVWKQWLTDVEDQIKANPALTCFSASPNDGYCLGNCVCESCRAWDHPDGDLRPSMWQGLAQRYVALSDRDVTFANHCARLLKERYPDRDYYVSMNAYGNSRPAPLETVPAGNVVISNVANMFWSLDIPDKDCLEGKTYSKHYADWGRLTKNQVWRPNTGNPAGWQNALPDVPIERVMKSFRFAVDNHCVGIIVDMIWEHWATQGPLYYALAHMTWDPSKDWRAVMDDYYRRGFGPAAAEIKAYWAFLEESRNRKVDDYAGEAKGYDEVYNQTFFDKAYGLLDQAATKVAGAPEKYRKRIEFVRVGLDHTKLISDLRQLSRQMLQRGLDNAETASLVRAKWDEIKRNSDRLPHAIHWGPIRPGKRMSRGGLFHPDFMKSAKAKHIAAWRGTSGRKTVRLRTAEEAGWELVFSDEFDRKELGDGWEVPEGRWTVEGGALRGSGTLASRQGFPGDDAVGYLRMEFDAVTDVRSVEFLGKKATAAARVSDLSSILHGKSAEEASDFLDSGYFFQFGGKWNKTNQIRRAGRTLVADGEPRTRIASNKVHRIVVESDGGRLSQFVDGRCVLTCKERTSIIGDGHNRVGFYFYTAAKVLKVKVYTKRLSRGLDLE